MRIVRYGFHLLLLPLIRAPRPACGTSADSAAMNALTKLGYLLLAGFVLATHHSYGANVDEAPLAP